MGVPSYVPSPPADTPAEYYFVLLAPEDEAQQKRVEGPFQHPQVCLSSEGTPDLT